MPAMSKEARKATLRRGQSILISKAKTIQAKCKAENRDLTPEEVGEFDRIVDTYDEVAEKIDAITFDSYRGGYAPTVPEVVAALEAHIREVHDSKLPASWNHLTERQIRENIEKLRNGALDVMNYRVIRWAWPYINPSATQPYRKYLQPVQ